MVKMLSLTSKASKPTASKAANTSKAAKAPTSKAVPKQAPAPPSPIGAGLGLFEDNAGSTLRRVVPAQAQREQTYLGERLGSL